jgi:hypothetical protein
MTHHENQTPFVAVLAIVGVLVLAPLGAKARSNGSETGLTTTVGCNCHGVADANGDVTATITAMDGDNTILASATETYMLAISLLGGDLVGTGIDIAVSDDDAGFDAFLGESSALTQIITDEITQQQENPGVFSYLFTVTAPAAMSFGSTVTLTALGLEFNDGQGSNGDSWDFATPFAFTVVPEPTTGLLFGMGLIGLTVSGRKRA